MKIAALQMVSTTDVARNLDTAAGLIDEAARGGARLVALPEYFCHLGRRDTDKLAIAEADGEGPIQQLLSDCARRVMYVFQLDLCIRVIRIPQHSDQLGLGNEFAQKP